MVSRLVTSKVPIQSERETYSTLLSPLPLYLFISAKSNWLVISAPVTGEVLYVSASNSSVQWNTRPLPL